MAKIIGSHTPAELRNLAINGAMDFFQRTEANIVTQSAVTGGVESYAADMFKTCSGGPSSKTYSYGRSTNIPTQAQSGFQGTYSQIFTLVNALASPNTADYFNPQQYRIEGNDYIKIHGKVATFGFWFNPSIAGTYSFAIRNSGGTRSYVTTFSAAIGWQFITITVQMDSSGTWIFDTGIGAYVDVAATTGASFQTSSLNSWQNGNFMAATGATDWNATAGATISMTQFSIVEGPLGFGAKGFARAGVAIEQELALCQRYYEKSYGNGTVPGTATATEVFAYYLGGGSISWGANQAFGSSIVYKQNKRPTPSVVLYNEAGVAGQVSANRTTGPVATTVFSTINSFTLINSSGSAFTVTLGITFHWTAEAGL